MTWRMLMATFAPARQRLLKPGTALAALIVITVVVAGLISPSGGYVPGLDVNPGQASQAPTLENWLGTDHLGRSIAHRIVHGCRAFTLPGALACLVALLLGAPTGALAGWKPGLLSSALRTALDTVACIPRLVLVLLVCTVFGPRLSTLAVGAGLAYTPSLAEAVRNRVSALRLAGHVEAWQAHGLSNRRILWVHLVALGCGKLLVRRVLDLFAFVLVLETTLSYIGGFGVQEPTPSWGNMMAFDWGHAIHPVSLIAPALAAWVTLAATYALSEAFAEAEP